MSRSALAVPTWWAGWRGEAVMVGLACSLVVLAYPTVIFGNRTFSTAWQAAGVNGVNGVPSHVDVPLDTIRVDAGASAWAFEPWAEVASRAWRNGEVPLWNPYQGMGTPLAANFQSAVFDPLLFAVHLHPSPLTWDIAFLLAFLLGAAAMYLFLRQIGLDRLPSLIGTAPFILSGFFFTLLDQASPTHDGVRALAEPGGTGTAAAPPWSRSLTPGLTPVEWEDVQIDLHGASTVDLAVTPIGQPTPNSVGFADLRFGFGPPPPPRQYQWVAKSEGADMYENTQRLPRAMVISDVTSVENENDALEHLRSRSRTLASGALHVDRFDPGRQAVVEGLPASSTQTMQGCSEPGTAAIRNYRANRVTIDVESACPGVLLLTDTYYPGWTATVNGAARKIYPTDIAFRGVPIEPGRSTVTFRYRPRSFTLGATIAATVIATSIAVGLVPGLRRRRRGRLRTDVP